MEKQSKILVLGGGQITVSYQVGVVCKLFENGYRPDVILGISGGALVGLKIIDILEKQKEPDFKKVGKELVSFWMKNIKSPESLIKKRGKIRLVASIIRKKFKGVYDNEPLKNLILKTTDSSGLYKSKVKCIVGAVDLDTGDITYVDNYSVDFLSHAIASSSIPVVFPPVKRKGKNYIDGGIIDSTPLKAAFKENPSEITCIVNSPEKIKGKSVNPGDIKELASHIISIALRNNLDNDIKEAEYINRLLKHSDGSVSAKKYIPLRIFRPNEEIDVRIDKFDAGDIAGMIQLGYDETLI